MALHDEPGHQADHGKGHFHAAPPLHAAPPPGYSYPQGQDNPFKILAGEMKDTVKAAAHVVEGVAGAVGHVVGKVVHSADNVKDVNGMTVGDYKRARANKNKADQTAIKSGPQKGKRLP